MGIFSKIFSDQLDRLAEPFERTDRQQKGNSSSPKNNSNPSLQRRFTDEIVGGNDEVLTKFIRRYSQGKKDDLVWLFKDNVVLATWVVEKAETKLVLSIPKEVRDMIDEILS